MEDYEFLKTESELIAYIRDCEDLNHIMGGVTKYLLDRKSHKQAGRVLRNLDASISCLRDGGNDDDESRGKYVLSGISKYLKLQPRNRKKLEHMLLFRFYGMHYKLIFLYRSPIKNNKEIAEEAIRLFLYPNIQSFPIPIQHRFANTILEFCRLLRDHKTTSERLLYYSCCETLESLLKSIGPRNTYRLFEKRSPKHFVRDFYPLVMEVTKKLLVNMKLIRESCFCRVPSGLKARFESDMGEFSILTLLMCTKIEEHMREKDLSLDSLHLVALDVSQTYYVTEIKQFYDDFSVLLNSIDLGLTYMDDGVEYTRCTDCGFNQGWSYYLSILKELDKMSNLYHPAEKNLSSCLYSHQVSINKLIMNSQRGDDHQWLLKHKSLIYNESRRHLIAMVISNQVKNGCDHPQAMKVIIDRSKLFIDSFEHVGLANPILLRNGINPQFKNEVALIAGNDILREWFLLVCQHLFSQQNSFFVSCPHDPQRLYPNRAKTDPQQLEYFRFCGRVVALALMHDVQIGIGFDRLFFLQLAGRSIITLEDVRDADPYIYKSCKDILEMDIKFIDSDGLGLTFVWESEEVDESGSGRKIVELCPGGRTMGVYSINREEYIELVIQHCFVRSISDKVKLFTRGLDDVLTRRCRKNLFQSIELEDLDDMLLERTICEKERGEHRNQDYSPFRRIIETTLPVSRPKSSSHSLTCRRQHMPFHHIC